MEREKDIAQLFSGFINNTCTPAEIDRLFAYFDHPDSEDRLRELVYQELLKSPADYPEEINQIIGRVDLLLKEKIVPFKRKKNLIPIVWSAAAVFLIVLAGVLWQNYPGITADLSDPTKILASTDDIAPGRSQAHLLLSNGKRVDLDGSQRVIENFNGAEIYSDNGQLSYRGAGEFTGSTDWNILEVPMGGTFEMKLPDGTKVWLNANSKLYFPDQFAVHERNVKVEGEAFFEVAKDSKRPFKVEVNELAIKVLGTSFNVRAYHPRDVSTTLVTGIVEATYQDKTLKLHPGKKLRFDADNGEFKIVDADIESAMAWKDGYFYFKDDTFVKILQDVALWYNLQVAVEGSLPNGRYSGSVDRNSKLSGVLAMITAVSGTDFVITEKKLIVKPR